MNFRFESNINTWDIWKLSMYNIYHSMVGVCNAIFAVAIVLLTIRFWDPKQELLMALLVLCCIVYPVIQPVAIYRRASKQVKALPANMVYEINDTGIHITVGEQKTHVTWNRVRGIRKEYKMIILALDGGRGYMLTDRMLGTQKGDFLDFLEAKVKSGL